MGRRGTRRSRTVLLDALVVLVALVTAAACGSTPDAPPGSATVAAITDGDTLRVRIAGTEERVRLLGIDTPETHGRGGLRECFGREATDNLRRLVPPGTAVRLERDVEARDRYGRLLAYVYRAGDGRFVNLAQVEEGFAAVLTYPPNVAHAEAFVAAAAEARRAGRGLWGRCGGADTPL